MFKNISYILMFGGVFYFSNKYFSLLSPENLISIAGIIATVAGILSGFSLAAITMLMGAVGNRVIKALNSNGLLKNLLHDLNINCVSLVFVSIISLLSMIFISSSISISIFDYVIKPSSILLSLAMSIMTRLLFSFFSTWRKISRIVGSISKM